MRWRSSVVAPAIEIRRQLAFIDAEAGVTEPSILDREQDLLSHIEQARDCDPRDPRDAVATTLILECFETLVLSSGTSEMPALKRARYMAGLVQPVTKPEDPWISLRSCGC